MTNTIINNTNDPQKKYHLGTVRKNILLEDLNQFYGANLALNSDVDTDTFGIKTQEITTHMTAKRSALSQQMTTMLQGTETTAQHTPTNMMHNLQKRSSKEALPWNGQ